MGDTFLVLFSAVKKAIKSLASAKLKVISLSTPYFIKEEIGRGKSFNIKSNSLNIFFSSFLFVRVS